MRNAKNILKLADFIASERYLFDMGNGSVHMECGSAGCIGGHAAVMWMNVRDNFVAHSGFTFDTDVLAHRLGLSLTEVDDLCFPAHDSSGETIRYKDITRAHAVETLRHLAKTGEVRFLKRLPKKEK